MPTNQIKTRTLASGAIISPLSLHCPACRARGDQPCTTPTDNGRREVKWFHHAREDAVDTVYYEQDRCHYDLGWHTDPHKSCFLRGNRLTMRKP